MRAVKATEIAQLEPLQVDDDLWSAILLAETHRNVSLLGEGRHSRDGEDAHLGTMLLHLAHVGFGHQVGYRA